MIAKFEAVYRSYRTDPYSMREKINDKFRTIMGDLILKSGDIRFMNSRA
jgi:hypothetical protein